jgi:hypothetical protein
MLQIGVKTSAICDVHYLGRAKVYWLNSIDLWDMRATGIDAGRPWFIIVY